MLTGCAPAAWSAFSAPLTVASQPFNPRFTYSDPSFSLEETRDEYAMRVLAALNAGGGKIGYEYDFGASWIHEIALQRKVPRHPGVSYPFCVKYSGDSPVEYPDYDSEEDQQPESFDVEAVNRRLAALGE